jgi:hypothetical protein
MTTTLSHLEDTVTQIAVELLLVEKEQRFKHLIMGNPEDKTSLRATMRPAVIRLSTGHPRPARCD